VLLPRDKTDSNIWGLEKPICVYSCVGFISEYTYQILTYMYHRERHSDVRLSAKMFFGDSSLYFDPISSCHAKIKP